VINFGECKPRILKKNKIISLGSFLFDTPEGQFKRTSSEMSHLKTNA